MANELPDYMTNPNAVFNDSDAQWRYGGAAPDYSRVNAVYDAEKIKEWPEGSLEWLVTNLVKNWEKEASHKVRGDQWRTVKQGHYRFSTNGGQWLTQEDMLKAGTYNVLIGDTELYSGELNSFVDSHKSFKRSLAVFAWEVLELYGQPPSVAFKWRHWGKMTGSFSCTARNGDTIRGEPTGENVEIFGMTTAKVDDKFQILELETFWNPDQMLTQLTKNKCPVTNQ